MGVYIRWLCPCCQFKVQTSNTYPSGEGSLVEPLMETLGQEKVLGPMTQCCAGEAPDGPLPMSLTWWWHRLVRLGLPFWLEGGEK